jgi:hypothetical protein
VVNVGAVASIIAELQSWGHAVTATDLDPSLVGKQICGIEVISGVRTAEVVAESDVAVVTGMTVSNGTIDNIIEAARGSGTQIIMFAESGASFAGVYLSQGIDCVISERFPFYIFQGASEIGIHRRPM